MMCMSLDIQLDENLLTVVQCVIGGHPDLTPDLVDCTVRLLETGTTLLAKNAKYGHLILNFIKAYRNQVYTSGGVYVPCIYLCARGVSACDFVQQQVACFPTYVYLYLNIFQLGVTYH